MWSYIQAKSSSALVISLIFTFAVFMISPTDSGIIGTWSSTPQQPDVLSNNKVSSLFDEPQGLIVQVQYYQSLTVLVLQRESLTSNDSLINQTVIQHFQRKAELIYLTIFSGLQQLIQKTSQSESNYTFVVQICNKTEQINEKTEIICQEKQPSHVSSNEDNLLVIDYDGLQISLSFMFNSKSNVNTGIGFVIMTIINIFFTGIKLRPADLLMVRNELVLYFLFVWEIKIYIEYYFLNSNHESTAINIALNYLMSFLLLVIIMILSIQRLRHSKIIHQRYGYYFINLIYFLILLANSKLIASYLLGFISFYLTLLGITIFDAYLNYGTNSYLEIQIVDGSFYILMKIYVGIVIPYYINQAFPYKMLVQGEMYDSQFVWPYIYLIVFYGVFWLSQIKLLWFGLVKVKRRIFRRESSTRLMLVGKGQLLELIDITTEYYEQKKKQQAQIVYME